MISFSETRKSHGPNQAEMEDGKYSHAFSSQKLLHSQNSVCQGMCWINQSWSQHYSRQCNRLTPSEYLPVVTMLNSLATQNKFLIN